MIAIPWWGWLILGFFAIGQILHWMTLGKVEARTRPDTTPRAVMAVGANPG